MITPVKCTNPICEHEFSPSNLIHVEGSHNLVQNFSTNCPICGSIAKGLDFVTDSKGDVHFKTAFNHLRAISNIAKLKQIKSDLNNLDQNVTSNQITTVLVKNDSGFSKFAQAFNSFPNEKAKFIKNLLIGLLTLYIAYQALKLQGDALILDKKKFEYRKQQDQIELKASEDIKIELDEMHGKIYNLEKEIIGIKVKNERTEIQASDKPNKYNQRRIVKEVDSNEKEKTESQNKIKGYKQYLKCECGSEKSVRNCHPYGYSVH